MIDLCSVFPLGIRWERGQSNRIVRTITTRPRFLRDPVGFQYQYSDPRGSDHWPGKSRGCSPFGAFRNPFCLTPCYLACRRCMLSLMEEGSPTGQHLKCTFRRHKEANVHILRPTRHTSRSDCEHTLDLEPVLKGSSFEDLDLLLGPQEHGSGASHQAPAFDDLSQGSSGECNRPPSSCQNRFKLDRPPSPSPFPSQSGGNVWPTSYLLPPPNVKDSLRQKQRKSCEYCRFRKKRCSGHDTCIRCFRDSIGCVYMPDLIAKRTVDCLLETSHPSLGSRFSYPGLAAGIPIGQPPHSDPRYSCATPSTLDKNPAETPPRPLVRSKKGKKRTPNGVAKRQKRLRPENASTQFVAPNRDQCIHLGVFGTAAEDTDLWNTGVESVSLDHCETLVPKYWDTSKLQEVFVDTPTIKPQGHADDTEILWLEISQLDTDPTGAEAIRLSGFDIPSAETESSVESLMDLSAPSASFPSIVLSSPGSTVITGATGDLAESWTADDWLAWCDSTLLPL